MNKHIHYLKSYQLIKQLYIYAYLYEIYKSYQKQLEKQAIIASLAAKEEKKSPEEPEPKPKTAYRNFFDPLTFSLGESHLKSKTTSRFFPLLHYDSRRGDRFLQNDPLGYQDSMNMYQGMFMNPYNFADPFGEQGVFESIGNWGLGAWKGIKSGVKGAAYAVTHPVQTVKGAFYIVTHPIKTAKAIKIATEIVYERFVNASSAVQSQMIGELTTTIMTIVLSTKGIEKLSKTKVLSKLRESGKLRYLDELAKLKEAKLIEKIVPKVSQLRNLQIKGFNAHHLLPEYLGKMLGYSVKEMADHPGIYVSHWKHMGKLNRDAIHKAINKFLPPMSRGVKNVYTSDEIRFGLRKAYEKLGMSELFDTIEHLIK